MSTLVKRSVAFYRHAVRGSTTAPHYFQLGSRAFGRSSASNQQPSTQPTSSSSSHHHFEQMTTTTTTHANETTTTTNNKTFSSSSSNSNSSKGFGFFSLPSIPNPFSRQQEQRITAELNASSDLEKHRQEEQLHKEKEEERRFIESLTDKFKSTGSWIFETVTKNREVEVKHDPNNAIVDSIVGNCPMLRKGSKFHPTTWLQNGHLQSIYNVQYREDLKNLKFTREVVETEYTTENLDWMLTDDKGIPFPDDAPTLVVVPGLCGGVLNIEIKQFVKYAAQNGYRSVVLNTPGHGNLQITSLQFGTSKNIRPLIAHISAAFPRAPLVACSFSMGSNNLVKYLGVVRGDTPLLAAMSVSNPFDLHYATSVLCKQPSVAQLYDTLFTQRRKEIVKRHAHLFKDHPAASTVDFTKLEKVKSTREFDDTVSRVVTGHATLQDLYAAESCIHALPTVAIPLLLLNSADDPVVGFSAEAFKIAQKNPNIITALTAYGGHVAWLDGSSPRTTASWMERLAVEYMNSCLKVINSKNKQAMQQQQQQQHHKHHQ